MKFKDSTLTFLGFDYGLRHIGIAVGQTITKTAKPLCSLQADKGDALWKQIAEIIREWQPDGIVIGLPLNMDGSEQAITKSVRNFAEILSERFKLPLYFADERLTTVAAKEALFAKKGYRGLKKSAIDAVSAQIILENWMRQHVT